jgi:hypothetical protein
VTDRTWARVSPRGGRCTWSGAIRQDRRQARDEFQEIRDDRERFANSFTPFMTTARSFAASSRNCAPP